MKKIFLFICLAAVITKLSAQSIKIDLNFGQNLSTISETESAEGKAIPNYIQTTTNAYSAGLHVGALAGINLGDFTVQTGLSFQNKGGSNTLAVQLPNVSLVPVNYRETDDYTLNYLEIPVNVIYNIPVQSSKLFIGGGIYDEIGLAGNVKYNYTGTDYTGTSTGRGKRILGFGSSGDIITPIYGISIFGGIRLDNGLSLGGGYEFGITNISGNGNIISKERTFNFSIGYTLFDKIKIKKGFFHL